MVTWEIIANEIGSSWALLIAFALVLLSQVLNLLVQRLIEKWKSADEIEAAIDSELREHRIDVYSELWKSTGILRLWPKPKVGDVTYEKLAQFSEELSDWYFEDGGIFLSEHSNEPYRKLQRALTKVLSEGKSGSITDEEHESLRIKCNDLRKALTADLLTRRKAPINPPRRS